MCGSGALFTEIETFFLAVVGCQDGEIPMVDKSAIKTIDRATALMNVATNSRMHGTGLSMQAARNMQTC